MHIHILSIERVQIVDFNKSIEFSADGFRRVADLGRGHHDGEVRMGPASAMRKPASCSNPSRRQGKTGHGLSPLFGRNRPTSSLSD